LGGSSIRVAGPSALGKTVASLRNYTLFNYF
jgi:hypothetical protein